MTNPFPLHTGESAPETVRGAMESLQTRMGFISAMLAKFAEAPALLTAYQAAAPIFDKTSLTPAERIVVLARTPPNPEFGDAIWQRRS
jgi:hypothetical protein